VTAGYTGPLIGLGALWLSLLNPAQAWAKPAAFLVTLEYAPAPGCPASEALQAGVVARLGYDPFAVDAPHHVSLRIVSDAGALAGRIEWRDAEGQWAGDQAFSMPSGDCLRLSRTMGLALAVQIQLLRDLNEAPAVDREHAAEPEPPPKAAAEPPGGQPAASSPPTQKVVPPAVSAVPRAASSGPQLSFALGAGPAIGFGMAPHPIFLGRVFGLLAWPHASIQLAAELSLPASTRRADGARISEQLLLLSAAGCGSVERWSACLVVNAGSVGLSGADIDHPTSTRLPFVDTGLRAGFSQPLGARSFVNAHADGLVILTRWTASLDDVPVWTMPQFAAAIGVDFGVRFR